MKNVRWGVSREEAAWADTIDIVKMQIDIGSYKPDYRRTDADRVRLAARLEFLHMLTHLSPNAGVRYDEFCRVYTINMSKDDSEEHEDDSEEHEDDSEEHVESIEDFDGLVGYVHDRLNGCDEDSPPRPMPKDGVVILDSPDAKTSKIRYIEGPGDRAWMEERDRNYVFRLEREGRLDDVEPNLRSEVPKLYKEVMNARRARAPDAGSAAEELGELHVSFEIPYSDLRIGKRLGAGGFGNVFEGTCRRFGRVAIKQLIDDYSLQRLDGLTACQRFMKEVSIMAELHHPNLVSLWGISCDDKHHYSMVMEYMSGGSLFDVLHSEKGLSWEQRWQIAMDIGQGVSFLHSRDILHHDLKSPNVLLSEDMRAKISDFGLSELRPTPGMLPLHMRSRTICDRRWAAPELFEEGTRYTKEADVFSYGIVLWELATGREPTGGKPRKKTIPSDCPSNFSAIIKRCWRTRTADRCTVDEAIEDLKTNQTEISHP